MTSKRPPPFPARAKPLGPAARKASEERASTPATSGVATLVPPRRVHPGLAKLSYTDTGVCGSETAETSATVRLEQPSSCCQAGFGSYALQPLPAPDQTVSDQPRELPDLDRLVPPTAITSGDAAGYATP